MAGSFPGFVSRTVRLGWKTIALLLGLNLVWVVIALILRLPPPTSNQPPWLSNLQTIVLALGEHVAAGFLVSAVTLKLERALIGAIFQPLIDIDHLTALLRLHIDPRMGHSVVLMVVLVVLAWQLQSWKLGRLDMALFVSSQFAIHFAVAPPGFPLLAPVLPTTFFFPALYPLVVGVLLCLLAFWLSIRP